MFEIQRCHFRKIDLGNKTHGNPCTIDPKPLCAGRKIRMTTELGSTNGQRLFGLLRKGNGNGIFSERGENLIVIRKTTVKKFALNCFRYFHGILLSARERKKTKNTVAFSCRFVYNTNVENETPRRFNRSKCALCSPTFEKFQLGYCRRSAKCGRLFCITPLTPASSFSERNIRVWPSW